MCREAGLAHLTLLRVFFVMVFNVFMTDDGRTQHIVKFRH